MIKNISYDELEEKKKKLNELIEANDDLDKKKVEIYKSFIEKSNVVSFFLENRYYFKHPDYDIRSARGPVLYEDKSNNKAYIYDLSDKLVKIIDLFNVKNDPKSIHLYKYFQGFDFDIAMKGLFSLDEFLDDEIKKLNSYKEESNNSLDRYSNILNDYKKNDND